MKMSRKMKKFFVTVLTVTLSIVMVVTSAGAINAQTCSCWVEHEDFDAFVQMTWYDDSDELQLTVDLSCYEDANIDTIDVKLFLRIYYYIVIPPNITGDAEFYEYRDTIDSEYTWDSDEIIINIDNFERGCAHSTTNCIDIYLDIECYANYSDGSVRVAFDNYEATLSNGNFESN